MPPRDPSDPATLPTLPQTAPPFCMAGIGSGTGLAPASARSRAESRGREPRRRIAEAHNMAESGRREGRREARLRCSARYPGGGWRVTPRESGGMMSLSGQITNVCIHACAHSYMHGWVTYVGKHACMHAWIMCACILKIMLAICNSVTVVGSGLSLPIRDGGSRRGKDPRVAPRRGPAPAGRAPA